MKRQLTLGTVALLYFSTSALAESETWAIAYDPTYNPPNLYPLDPDWLLAGDVNFDGLTDLIKPNQHYAYTQWTIDVSDGVGGFQEVTTSCYGTTGLSWGYPEWRRAGDFNRDGILDYVAPNGSTVLFFSFNSGAWCPSFSQLAINGSWGGSEYTFAGDFNGDGYDDIASAYGSNVYMKFGGTTPFSTSATWTVTNQWGSGVYTKVGDFNRDGYDDIASMNAGTAFMKLGSGSGFTSTSWSVVNQWGQGGYTFAGDFNADGYADIASCHINTCYMKQSTGSGFTNPGNQTVSSTWSTAPFTFVGNFENDGNVEIASVHGGLNSSVYMKLLGQ